MTDSLLIVAHGQPSDPAPAEAEMAAFARAVAGHLPGWTVASATLADPAALGRALAPLSRPLVFPFFMADGWFIRTLLPERLAAAGAAEANILCPFGLLPGTPALAAAAATAAAGAAGWEARETTLILAAHGSGQSRKPAEAARAIARSLGGTTAFAEIRTGFIEEAPRLAEALTGAPARSILLPLFVARWGHVQDDIPAAVAATGFAGIVLPPLGQRPEVPAMVADAARDRTPLPP